MIIGLFVNATTVVIPANTLKVETAGYSTVGKGAAIYMRDATVSDNTLSTFLASDGAGNTSGYRLSAEQDVGPEQFGAVGNMQADDHPALQAWADFITTRRVIGRAHLSGKYAIKQTLVLDWKFDAFSYTPDENKTTTLHVDGAMILGIPDAPATLDHLVHYKNCYRFRQIGLLHLLGAASGVNFPARKVANGAYMENMGLHQVDGFYCENMLYSGYETADAPSNVNNSIVHSLTARRVGSTPRDGDANGLRFNFDLHSETGSLGSYDQRSILTVTKLPPAYLDGTNRVCNVLIGGHMYSVKAIDRSNSRISIFPFLPATLPATQNCEYYFGSAAVIRGSDANLIRFDNISALVSGGAIDWVCLYPGQVGTLHCEGGGIAMRIGSDPSQTQLGLTVGRFYCEGTKLDLLMTAANADIALRILSAAPVEVDKFQSGAEVRYNNARDLSVEGLAGLTVGGDEGEFFRVMRPRSSTVVLDFNKPRTRNAFIAAPGINAWTFNLAKLEAHMRTIFGISGGQLTVMGTGSTGAPSGVTFNPPAGQTINGASGPASFGTAPAFTGPVQFACLFDNVSNWIVRPV